ncbi:outer membrane usher protein [Sphingomonas naasensis]|uniref:hypothetical protein n=1 Tax=Sphingomonas naasensis TaxID=1344951 RepID=UPI001F0CF276|nr:hypothetical protein [Sphingomonas naasensis]NIJ21592.1 outer membrane usher protein [Sphingomonas naasensis]
MPLPRSGAETPATPTTPAQQTAPVPLPNDKKPAPEAALPTVGQDSASKLPIGKYGRPDINPYDRDLDLTVPLLFKRRSLGDLTIRLTFDDRLLVDTKAFQSLVETLLNDEARSALTQRLQNRDHVTSEDLAPLGIAFEYDPSSLAVVVLTIDPGKRAAQQLFDVSRPPNDKPDIEPASVAGFLNINVFQSYRWNTNEAPPPALNLNGAIRYGGIVFEGDGQFAQQGFANTGNYSFERNYARFVYDEPAQYRRWFLGDLSTEIRGQQGFAQMGGIGVSRQRQRFDPYRSSVLQSNRQLILQRDSSVRILRNGVLYRELRLDAGAYDFSALPLLSGSNDVQIEVRDNAGGVQSLAYSSYLDPIDLVPGDFEYAAYVGPISTRFGQSPVYNGPVAFSGFFRKAFLNAPAVGVGLQATAHVQTLTGQTQFVLSGGSRLLLDGGVSHSREAGAGVSVGAGFEQLIDRGGLVDSATLRVDYLSRRYAFISSPDADNNNAVNITGQYTRAINQRIWALVTGSYLKSRDRRDSYRIGVSANYNLTRELSVRGGVDYSRFDQGLGRGSGIGFNVAIVFQPNYRDRFEARHDGALDSSSLSYTHTSSSRIGSVGYGATVNRDGDALGAQGFADYIANRFDATLSHASYGPSLGRFGSDNVTGVRVGTSLAFADGAFGLGRRINDSFAVLYAHDNLKGRSVVAGQSLANNDYMSKSGTFGGAVNGYLSSYVTQSIQYDIENPPAGYDIGAGTVRVNPPYHSGYKLKIGTDAFVSAAGVLTFPNGTPVALAGGRVIAKDGKDKEPIPFFTNSVGRFAIQNLRPAIDYRVELGSGSAAFEFRVPADTTGLVDLKTIVLKLAN